MGAHLDKTRRIYFLHEHHERVLSDTGATVGDYPEDLPLFKYRSATKKRKPSWCVCPHLSSPEKLLCYFQDSGSIMVLLGKCFCYECYEMILSRWDIEQYMKSSEHMTDIGFQNQFIKPLFEINREVLGAGKAVGKKKAPKPTWKVCTHVSDVQILQRLYAGLSPIFFQAGFLTCNHCYSAIPAGSDTRAALQKWHSMTDKQLQKEVINKLYPINRKVLKALGLCS